MVVCQSRSRCVLIWSKCSVLAAWSGCFEWYARRTVQRGFKNIYRKCEVTTESNPKFKSSRTISGSCPITKEFWKNLPQALDRIKSRNNTIYWVPGPIKAFRLVVVIWPFCLARRTRYFLLSDSLEASPWLLFRRINALGCLTFLTEDSWTQTHNKSWESLLNSDSCFKLAHFGGQLW